MKLGYIAIFAGIFSLFSSCQSLNEEEPFAVSPQSISMYTGENYQIVTNKNSGITFQSENNFFASVDDEGLVSGSKVGETVIKVSYNNEQVVNIPVVVNPSYKLFPDFDQLIGSPQSYVINQMGSNYSIVLDMWSYSNYNQYAAGVAFSFDPNNRVRYIIVAFPMMYLDLLTKYLQERYIYLGPDSGGDQLYTNYEKKVGISCSLYTSEYLNILYYSSGL